VSKFTRKPRDVAEFRGAPTVTERTPACVCIFHEAWLEGLLEHPWADLHAEGNYVVDRQTSALRLFATSFAVGCLELAERVLTIGRKMTSNPLNSGHLMTDGYYLASDLVELVRWQGVAVICS